MTGVLKCPLTGEVKKAADCLKCDWVQQVKPESVECEVVWKRHITLTYNPEDPKGRNYEGPKKNTGSLK